jgi:hypothetical protein
MEEERRMDKWKRKVEWINEWKRKKSFRRQE